MLTATISQLDPRRPHIVRLRLDKEALEQLGTRVVMDRAHMTLRSATLDERHHLNISPGNRSTSFRLPDETLVQHYVGDYWLKDMGDHFQLIRDDYEGEDE